MSLLLEGYSSKRNRLVWVAFLVAGAASFLPGCGGAKLEVTASAQTAPPVASVVVGRVVAKTVPIFTELTARTDASDSVEIRARVKAFLQKQSYEEGTIVRAGQTLFTLDAREYAAQLTQAKAQLAKAEADLTQAEQKTVVDVAQANLNISMARLNKANQDVKRLKPLAEQRAVPQQDFDNALAEQQGATADVEGKQASMSTAKVNQTASIQQAQAAVQAANASIRQAELNVEYCTVTTPIEGIAGTRQVAPGNLVGQTEATLLTTVSKVNPMRVHVSISEADYLKYQRLRTEGKLRGRAAELELIMADGTPFPHKGRFIIADRAVDLKTGTFSLVAEFPNPKALMRPGQFGRVRLAATVAENALLVPQKAVTEIQSTKVVYAVTSDKKVAVRSVTLGERVGNDYIITSGVKAGDVIVVEGLQKVKPGAVVNPVEQPITSEQADRKGGR